MKFGIRIALMQTALVLGAPLIMKAQNSATTPIATVDGQPIYEQDLMSVAGAKLIELQNQEYKLKSEALDRLVLNKLIQAEAKRKGLSVEEFLKQEVDSKIAEPSDDEARGYYFAGRNQTTLSFDEIKPQLKRLLRAAEIQEARDKYIDSLRAKADVAIMLHTPKAEIDYDTGRVRGDSKAPVTVVEFSDFQCPYCKRVQPTLKDLLAKYEGKIKLAFRDFPLRQLHPQAEMAAEASRCAKEQGKFWEYHDALFADQTRLDEAGLTATAKEMGLDLKSFQSCLDSGKFKAQIEQDIQDGARAGVSGTPGFFINGIFVSGSQPQSEFEKIIDRELAGQVSGQTTRASR